MMHLLSLRFRLFFLLGILIIVYFAGAALTFIYTSQNKSLYSETVDQNLKALMTAQKLQNSMLIQKGFVTYYSLTGSEDWIKQLETHNQNFRELLKKARKTTFITSAISVLNQIESKYIIYENNRNSVIEMYRKGKSSKGIDLHWNVRNQFFEINDLFDKYIKLHEDHIAESRDKYLAFSSKLQNWVFTSIPLGLVLVIMISFILYRQVFNPIIKLINYYGTDIDINSSVNEVSVLKNKMEHLVEDVDETKSELEKSREMVIHSEKMALVGKLAAGVAHSVRNPLTSVKIRLFSLERGLNLTSVQKEDFEVISEEIWHIDNVLQNFLEFSRSPKLKFQKTSPSDVIDQTIQLVKHRLDSYGTEVILKRKGKLPEIMLDPDQLKEVFVNLIVNACEAIENEGIVTIEESISENDKKSVVITVSDNGPGIPETIREQIFQPFFTEKNDGTGLGLSICRNLMEKHGGTIDLLDPEEGKGATFKIVLPFKEEEN